MRKAVHGVKTALESVLLPRGWSEPPTFSKSLLLLWLGWRTEVLWALFPGVLGWAPGQAGAAGVHGHLGEEDSGRDFFQASSILSSEP